MITPQKDCTGCTACMSICQHKAISMEKDIYGFSYPHVDETLCIDCGLCKKICPSNTQVLLNQPIKAYAGTAVNKEELKTSSSGAMATILSYHIVEEGGVVYGCSGEDYRQVRHVRIEHKKDLWKLKGSKYVQSELAGIFRKVKEDLRSKNVLFIGTPCQVAGLRAFLRADYENLFLVDFVCHGVPSQQILKDAMETHLPAAIQEPLSISFRRRNSHTNESIFGAYLKAPGNKQIYEGDFPKDHYISGFLLGLFYRVNCHVCKYAQLNRASDITVGDFYDATDKCRQNGLPENGLSTLLVNTSKGAVLFDAIRKDIECVEYPIEEMRNGHQQLRHPFLPHPKRHIFFRYYKRYGFNWAIERSLYRFLWSYRLRPLIILLSNLPGGKSVLDLIKSRIG